ncbi:hypothetical protein C3L33_21729, partial [Rhododendron williamsianum]
MFATMILVMMAATTIFITSEEFKLFHNIDRRLYTHLTKDLYHDPLESMRVMALWLWLERSSYFTRIIKRILSLPFILINELADEAVTCLNWVIPMDEREIREFFTQIYGDCIESLYMQVVQLGEQSLFSRIVFYSPSSTDLILNNGEGKVKFNHYNGKHVWMQKFVPKHCALLPRLGFLGLLSRSRPFNALLKASAFGASGMKRSTKEEEKKGEREGRRRKRRRERNRRKSLREGRRRK